MPRKSVRKSVKRQRARSRSGRNSVRRKSSVRRKRKSVKPSSSSSSTSTATSSTSGPRRSRARSRARRSLSRRSSTRRASTRRKRKPSVAAAPAPAPSPAAATSTPRKSSVRRKRRRNTGSILTFYCIECQADKNISNLRNLEYTHVAADTNRIKILATCGKCKSEVSRIVSPQQFQQLRKKKRIYEVLDGRPNNNPPSLKANTATDLYSFPSAPKTSGGGSGGAIMNDDGGSSSGSDLGSGSDDDDEGRGGNSQAEMIQGLSGSTKGGDRSPSPVVDADASLKRMEKPPDLKEMGTSSYNFKCV